MLRKTARLNVHVETRLAGLVRMEAQRRRLSVRAVVEEILTERYGPRPSPQEGEKWFRELRALRREVNATTFNHLDLPPLSRTT